MYRTLVFVFTAMLFATAAHGAKTYKWVDDRGVTHFSTRQPPRVNSDKTRLQGGAVSQPKSASELARIKRQDLTNPGWQGCQSDLCQLVQRIDANCQTSFCSRAKRYSSGCTTAVCLTKKLAFESDMRGRVAAQKDLRKQQAVNASATPTAPAAAPASRNDD
jgi:hypothetical protein